ncbi:tubulin polymerization-promoting protein homolog [Bacillus rossius redtenbacheri]|uniref:tubulin polymerization-promoting protein homolog n=1 Tax=Bacillus rossius redtenbacheri TaxID=93214 RepID=UPI002FDE0A19
MAAKDSAVDEALKATFTAFSQFGNTRSDGSTMTLSQSDKWMKEAKVIDRKLTATDTAIAFQKFKSKTLTFDQYLDFIEDLAKSKGVNPQELKSKLAKSMPSLKGTTALAESSVTDRLTDTSQYTGAHKSRFDEEGRGRGIEGRADIADNTGYVSGYKGPGKKR